MRVKMSVNLNLINVGSNQQHRKEEGWKEGRRAAARLDTRPLSVKTLACATFKRGLISGLCSVPLVVANQTVLMSTIQCPVVARALQTTRLKQLPMFIHGGGVILGYRQASPAPLIDTLQPVVFTYAHRTALLNPLVEVVAIARTLFATAPNTRQQRFID